MTKRNRTRETDMAAINAIRLTSDFERPDLLGILFGAFDQNLIVLENRLNVNIAARGTRVTIEGESTAAHVAQATLQLLYDQVAKHGTLEAIDIDQAVATSHRSAHGGAPGLFTSADGHLEIRTRRKTIQPRSPTQVAYMKALASSHIIFALGPAGTGKTYLAVAQAVSQLINGSVERLILSRPAVEAGERLGFLPGDMKEKVDPYLRPLYDALYDMLPAEQVDRRLTSGEIEIAPLAFMRGRTLSDAFVILDEAQNTTAMQMKMMLTRFGQRCRMVICGDPHQVDLPQTVQSGLVDAIHKLDGIPGIAMLRFDPSEVVRHPLVGHIVKAYGDGAGEAKLANA